METKSTRRFELRLTPRHQAALQKMADKRGETMSGLIKKYIEGRARREGLWK